MPHICNRFQSGTIALRALLRVLSCPPDPIWDRWLSKYSKRPAAGLFALHLAVTLFLSMLSAMNDRLFTMPSSSKVLLFSAAFGLTSALPWTGPKPTLTYVQANWTPRPTQGSIAKRELFARSLFFSANTCGWTGGDFSSVVTCSSLSSCVWDTARSFIGCCPSNAPCSTGVYTGCVDAQSGSQTVIDPAVTTWYVSNCPQVTPPSSG